MTAVSSYPAQLIKNAMKEEGLYGGVLIGGKRKRKGGVVVGAGTGGSLLSQIRSLARRGCSALSKIRASPVHKFLLGSGKKGKGLREVVPFITPRPVRNLFRKTMDARTSVEGQGLKRKRRSGLARSKLGGVHSGGVPAGGAMSSSKLMKALKKYKKVNGGASLQQVISKVKSVSDFAGKACEILKASGGVVVGAGRAKRKISAWNLHLRKVRKQHPNLAFGEVAKLASKTYH